MRHGIAGNKLNRKSQHRKATVRDMAKATLVQQRICTTKAKAKEARRMVDKLITLGKKGTLADKRRAFAILCDHKIVSDLFTNIAGRFQNRVGGYTRIIPLNNRRGDNAQLAFLELTEKVIEVKEEAPKDKASSKKKSGPKAKAAATEEKAGVVEADAKAEDSTEKKPIAEIVKKDAVKGQSKVTAKDEKKKGSKFSGIRKMFNRKSQGK